MLGAMTINTIVTFGAHRSSCSSVGIDRRPTRTSPSCRCWPVPRRRRCSCCRSSSTRSVHDLAARRPGDAPAGAGRGGRRRRVRWPPIRRLADERSPGCLNEQTVRSYDCCRSQQLATLAGMPARPATVYTPSVGSRHRDDVDRALARTASSPPPDDSTTRNEQENGRTSDSEQRIGTRRSTWRWRQIEKQFGKGSIMRMGEKGVDGHRGHPHRRAGARPRPRHRRPAPRAGSSRSSARSRRASPRSPCTSWPRPSATAASAPTSTPSTPWTRSTPGPSASTSTSC